MEDKADYSKFEIEKEPEYTPLEKLLGKTIFPELSAEQQARYAKYLALTEEMKKAKPDSQRPTIAFRKWSLLEDNTERYTLGSPLRPWSAQSEPDPNPDLEKIRKLFEQYDSLYAPITREDAIDYREAHNIDLERRYTPWEPPSTE